VCFAGGEERSTEQACRLLMGISRHTGRGQCGMHNFGQTAPFQPIGTTGDFIAIL
jgi:hypothetical protein